MTGGAELATHQAMMSQRAEPDKRDPDPQCRGQLTAVSGGFWDDVRWTVYECQKCHTAIAAVSGGAHWWNYCISDESRQRLGLTPSTGGHGNGGR